MTPSKFFSNRDRKKAASMPSNNILVLRCHRLLKRLREFPAELQAQADPAFSPGQIDFLAKHFAELRLLLLED